MARVLTMSSEEQDLLQYYKDELTYLRKRGAEFAQKYPKVAGLLGFDSQPSNDPHLERLLEGFAFLTGRLQLNLDREFPEFTKGLLHTMFPQFQNPIPSMSIMQMIPEGGSSAATPGFQVEKKSTFEARTNQKNKCSFQTAYPVDLWPLEITHADFESTTQHEFLDAMPNAATVLRLSFRNLSEFSLDEMDLKSLRFYLHGDSSTAYLLYEMLFCNVARTILLSKSLEFPRFLPHDSIFPVGFSEEEGLLGSTGKSYHGYRLLMEFFAFPEKFLFFDLKNLNLSECEDGFELLIVFDRLPKSRIFVDKDTFRLGCTPILNLFEQVAEPVKIDHQGYEFQIFGEASQDESTELHSVLKVEVSIPGVADLKRVEPFFSYHHYSLESEEYYWHLRREASNYKEGTDAYLSFLSLESEKLALLEGETLFVNCLCTNRSLAEMMPSGAKLDPLKGVGVYGACLLKPTNQIDPSMDGETYWKLISQLSLNYLSLSDGEKSLEALQEILKLYNFTNQPSTLQQIHGIRSMRTDPVVRIIGKDAWRGFCDGTEITLVFDESFYVGSSAFLLGSVLNHFFAMSSSVNSFTQLVIKTAQVDEVWKRWEPQVGSETPL